MCIHGDKSQQERDWVLSGKLIIWLKVGEDYMPTTTLQ